MNEDAFFTSDEELRRKRREVIDDFIKFINEPGNEYVRFWQAVRNWSGRPFILASEFNMEEYPGVDDTFYWEGRDG